MEAIAYLIVMVILLGFLLAMMAMTDDDVSGLI